ncbi:MAG: hypothetical protein KGQ40_10355, partial [Rhodospirillales bacterium]|nr:hypothetical protein [Rhodospirillales bacterium]
AGGLIGRSWTGAAVGGLVGGALGFLTSRAFAHQLGCADQHRLARDTQLAATAPKGHRISYAPARTSDGQKVSGYVMPVSNWYTDAQGRKVRDVRQVLSDGQHTQTSTVQVAQNDLAPGQKGYVMPQ